GAMLARSAASANVVPLANATVVVDATGVGLAVVDLVARLPGMWDRVVRVVVTAGQAASYDRGTVGWHVPRKELIGVLQTLMQTGRLAIASSLPEARTLVEEMQLFKARAKAASGDALEDWRERDHDDLVLSLALPLWYAEQNPPQAWNEDFWFACGGMDPFGR
ncbi:MAG TPA: hypothetical protein VFE62_29035, partial [Gemmataceae bacterium]|nr:hypothetical protein [Gemmataceae bacterium]